MKIRSIFAVKGLVKSDIVVPYDVRVSGPRQGLTENLRDTRHTRDDNLSFVVGLLKPLNSLGELVVSYQTDIVTWHHWD